MLGGVGGGPSQAAGQSAWVAGSHRGSGGLRGLEINAAALEERTPITESSAGTGIVTLGRGGSEPTEPSPSVGLEAHHPGQGEWRVVLLGKKLGDAMGHEVLRTLAVPESKHVWARRGREAATNPGSAPIS